MARVCYPSLKQSLRGRLLPEAALAALLSLLLIVFSGTAASPGPRLAGLPGHTDFTPVHDSGFIPARQQLLVNARHHADPEDASDSGDDAGLTVPASASGIRPPFSPRYTSPDLQHLLLQASACPARAPPRFS